MNIKAIVNLLCLLERTQTLSWTLLLVGITYYHYFRSNIKIHFTDSFSVLLHKKLKKTLIF